MNVKTAARAYGLTINEQPDIVIGAGDAILGKCTKTSIGLADGDESLAAIEPDLDAVCLSVSDVFQLDGKNQLRTQDMLTENKRLIGIQLVSDREEPGFGTFPSFYPIGRDRSAYGQHRTRAGNPCRGVSANLTRNPSPIDTHSIFPFVGSVLNVAVPSLPAEGPYTEREKHERQRVWPPCGWLPEGRWWPVTQIHARASGLRRRARLLRRLDSKPCGLRASHRQRFGRAHGLRVRSTQTDRTGVERGGHRISLAGRRGKPAGQAEGKPNNPRDN